MARGPMTEAHKAAMKAGREKVKRDGRLGRKHKEVAPPADPVWTFNIDDKGALAIIDENGEGIEIKPDDAHRLRAFLSRALPPQLADMTLREATRNNPTPEEVRVALGIR